MKICTLTSGEGEMVLYFQNYTFLFISEITQHLILTLDLIDKSNLFSNSKNKNKI